MLLLGQEPHLNKCGLSVPLPCIFITFNKCSHLIKVLFLFFFAVVVAYAEYFS